MAVPRVWKVAEPMTEDFRAAFPGILPTVLQLLWNRGLKEQTAIDSFLTPTYEKDIHDPFLFRDMEKAVERIRLARDNREMVVIHGDYDADGVCASTLTASVLDVLGVQRRVFLPHREQDGYGLNLTNVAKFADEGVKVLITCDCGIANVAEIELAESRGINVIITDHHTIGPVVPPAFAIIHPKVPGETYPWDGLAGGGVAFKFAQALLRRLGGNAPGGPLEKWLLDLVAISSVADMVPLLGETRTLVKYGLLVLGKTKRVGLRSLMRVAGVIDDKGVPKREIDATTIGFQIAPRINAAGRLQSASLAFDLLAELDSTRADERAAALHALNLERQRLTELCLGEARAQILERRWSDDAAIVVAGDWPPGIVGLLAGRLTEAFYRPVFVVSLKEKAVGSGRAIPGYHVVEAMQTFPHVFEKFGGHPQACGFTVRDGMVDELREKLRAHAADVFARAPVTKTLAIDGNVMLRDLTEDFEGRLRQFAPFGMGNTEPIFAARGVTVRDLGLVGQEGKHLRLSITDDTGAVKKIIAFGFGEHAKTLAPGDKIDAAFTVGINEWMGRRELQLKLVDLQKV